MRKTGPALGSLFVLALTVAAAPARAQLIGDTPPSQQHNGTPTSASSQQSNVRPTGKRRLSKDFTLKGDSIWTDTGIDLNPGEHVVVTAKGTLRYADAKEDNGPEGLTRGF